MTTTTSADIQYAFDGHEFTFSKLGFLDWSFQSNIHSEISGKAPCLAEAKVKAMEAIGYSPF